MYRHNFLTDNMVQQNGTEKCRVPSFDKRGCPINLSIFGVVLPLSIGGLIMLTTGVGLDIALLISAGIIGGELVASRLKFRK
jgi:hypothetical protein